MKNPHVTPKKVEARVYPGLIVGGNRRTDIKQQSGPRAIKYNYDLLRKAITVGAIKVIEYLAGPRPLAAYTVVICTA